jgi:hypothetical protein
MGEFRFLVRFPPNRKIADTLISDITYFRMKKGGSGIFEGMDRRY